MSKSQEIANLQIGLDLEMQSFAREVSNTKKQVRNLAKDFDVASKSIDSAEDKVEAIGKALEKGSKAFDGMEKKLQMQNKQFDDLYKKTEKQRKQYDDLADKLKKAEKALDDMAQSGDKSSSAYKDQEQSVKELKKALADKLELIQKNSHKLQQYSTDIDRTSNDMKKLKNSMDDLETSMTEMDGGLEALDGIGESADNSTLSLDSLALGAKGAAIAVASVFAKEVYDGAIAFDEAILGIRLSLGLAEREAKNLYDQINEISGDGGYSVEGVAEAVTLLQKRFNLTSEETKDLSQSMDLLNRMGYDSADVTRFMTSAVNDWVMSHTDALDMIIAGEQTGLNISNDWLDTLVEYTPILSTLGVTGEEAFALVDEAVNATGMTTDQAMDMVKEFFLTLTDGSTTSKDAFADLGIDIDNLKNQIDSGAITSTEAMQKVMKAIMDVGDETEQARLMQEIFKGTVEYGSDGVVQAWSNMEGAVRDTTGAMNEAKDAYEESYAAMQQDLSNEWNELKQTIGGGVIPTLISFADIAGKVIQTIGIFPEAMNKFFVNIMNDISNAMDGGLGAVLEFTSGAGTMLANFLDTIGMDDWADSVRNGVEGIDDYHTEVVDNMRKRDEETARLSEEYQKKLDAIWSESEREVNVETEDAEKKIQQLTKTYHELPPDVKTILKAEKGNSEEETLRLYNLYEQLPPEVQTVIKADNYNALDGAKSVQDVLANIPTETLISILTNIQESGNMSAGQLQMILDALPEEERVKVETSVAGKEQIEQTKQDLENLPKQSTSNVTVNTGDSKAQVQSVKQEVESINGKTYKSTFQTDTATASKNVTGLKKNISDYDSKHGNKTKKTTFNSITAQASKNVTGLKNNISSFVSKYAKSFTTTFNVLTKYSTIGTPTTQSKVAKPISASVPTINPLINAARSTFEPYSTEGNARTISTPRIGLNPSSVLAGIELNVNLLEDIENQLVNINNQLDLLDEKSKDAFGQEKIDYLKQQINLYKEQNKVQREITKNLQIQQNELKYFLSQNGYGFNSDGTIKNYQNTILNIEKQLDLLKEAEGDSNKSKITDLEKTKKFLQEYMDITVNKLPAAQIEWENLHNKINIVKDEIDEVIKVQNELVDDAKIRTLTNTYKDLEHELNKIDKLLTHSNGQEKIQLLDKNIELLETQKRELQNQYELLNSQRNSLQNQLYLYDFTFDSKGDITNHAQQLDKLFSQGKDIDEVNKLLEKYFDLQNNELPKIEETWLDLDNAIKNTLKNQLDTVKEIEDEITEIYEKQVQDRIDLINKELDKKLSALDKEKNAYNDARKEADYQRDYDDQMDAVSDLEKQIEIAKKDTSLSGQKHLNELLSQLADEQRKLEDLVQQKIDDQVNDAFDAESDRLEEENDKVIEDLENKWSDSKIAEMVAAALGSGTFTDIEGNINSLEDALINFAKESGDLFGVLGSTIQDELVGSLEEALDTFKELDSILNQLDRKSINRMSIPYVDYNSSRYAPSYENTENITNNKKVEVNFNQPLCVIEGSVEKETLPDLNTIIKKTADYVTKEIVNYMK